MRLLRIDSLKVVDFPGNAPPYAILSHTWGDEEVTLQDLKQPPHYYRSKAGFAKLRGCCKRAARDGFEYVWIDTCCIDKRNSVELSEAINSMYQWYRNARVCYAYLADVPSKWVVTDPFGRASGFDRFGHLKNSRWFTRGWTLQELLAPSAVEFYTADWSKIGTKSSLHSKLASITGINEMVLSGDSSLYDCSVAERMSWAAARSTTRLEDMAYSLLGIFDVNMPLIYGEGEKAFSRLQEEIMRNIEDYSILAWGLLNEPPGENSLARRNSDNLPAVSSLVRCNPLAPSPGLFKVELGWSPTDITYHIPREDWTVDTGIGPSWAKTQALDHGPPLMTARGLSISLPLCRPDTPEQPWLAYIGCQVQGKAVCIPLSPSLDGSTSTSPVNVFHRLQNLSTDYYYYAELDSSRRFEMARIYIKRQVTGSGTAVLGRSRLWYFDWNLKFANDLPHCSLWPMGINDRERLGSTHDKELFVVVLSRTGVGILPLDPSVHGPSTPTFGQVCAIFECWDKWLAASEVLRVLPESAKAAMRALRTEGKDEVTHRFENCAITVSMKRTPEGYSFSMSSQITCSKYILLDSTTAPPGCPETEKIKREMEVRRKANDSKGRRKN